MDETSKLGSENYNLFISSSVNINFNGQISSQVKRRKSQNDDQKAWTAQQIKLLQDLYLEYGPAWTFFELKFGHRRFRKANDIKNKMNNAIRRIASLIDSYDLNKQVCHSSTKQKVHSILKVCFQVDQHIRRIHAVPNSQSMIHSFKNRFIRLCFQEETVKQELQGLLKIIKHLNTRLKGYGVFKAKSQKCWKLSPKSFRAIMLFDNPFIDKKEDNHDRKNKKQDITAHKEAFQANNNKEESINDDQLQVNEFCFDYQKVNVTESLYKEYCEILGLDFFPSDASISQLEDPFNSACPEIPKKVSK